MVLYSRKVLIGSILSIYLLLGCGSDSSTEEENSFDSRKECVDLPKIKAGDAYSFQVKNLRSGGDIEVQVITTEISTTKRIYDVTFLGDSTTIGTNVETISIHDNYLDVYKIVTKNRTTESGATLEFSPYSRSLYTRACKGMHWINDYNLSTTVTGKKVGTLSHQKYTSTVEAINEVKRIALGTYATVRIKVEKEDGSTNIIWEDMHEAKTIYRENYDVNGKLVETEELIEE